MARNSSSRLPRIGTSNQNTPISVTSTTSTKPISAKGTVLPRMNSAGVIGVTMICSIVPISFSRTTAMLVSSSVISATTITSTPGTKKLRLSRFSLNHARMRSSAGRSCPPGPAVRSMRSARTCSE